jgi:predicted TIM-barrel fold metal-dependent hydrolase
LRAFVPDTQILFGTDYPYVSEDVVERERQGFDAYAALAGPARAAVERSNAQRLFPRLA